MNAFYSQRTTNDIILFDISQSGIIIKTYCEFLFESQIYFDHDCNYFIFFQKVMEGLNGREESYYIKALFRTISLKDLKDQLCER